MDDTRRALTRYRLEKAERCIKTAHNAVQYEDYETAANRSYYAMFHCVRALLAIEAVDYKKHSMVIGHFRREYIKTGIFSVQLSDYIGEAFEIRGKSDYNDFCVISKKDVEKQIRNAEEFYQEVRRYIEEVISKDI